MRAAVREFLPVRVIARATGSMRLACAEGIAWQMQMPTESATLRMLVWGRLMRVAFATAPGPHLHAVVRDYLRALAIAAEMCWMPSGSAEVCVRPT